MADDLETLVGRSEGEGPSPRFMAALRNRILEEASETGEIDSTPDETRFVDAAQRSQPMETGAADLDLDLDVDLDLARSAEPPSGRWRIVTTFAAAAALMVGAFVVISDSSTLTTTIGEERQLDTDAEPLTDEFSDFEPGTYRVDAVGTQFTFTADEPRRVAINSQGQATVMHIESQAPGDRVIAFRRFSALSDPRQPSGPVGEAEAETGWPADDFEGWLDAASDWIVVTDRQRTTLGGLDATRADIGLREVECDSNAGTCPLLGTNQSVHGWSLYPGWSYRVWIVDQDGEDPLAVIVSVNRASDRDWLDTAETILSTLVFGEVTANPVTPGASGPTELSFLGGIEVELTEGSFAVNEPGGIGRIPLSDWQAETVFLTDPLDIQGNRLETVDDLVATLSDAGVEIGEFEDTTIAGVAARSFDITADGADATLKPSVDGQRAWSAPPQARMWAIEHPDRGLLVITAEVTENIDLVFPMVVSETERIIRSLRFGGSG